ncbi:pentapeptide repeat-containing protein [Thermosynechococcus sp. FA-CM-4201]
MSITIEELIKEYEAGTRDFSGQQVFSSSTVYNVDLSGINLQGAQLTEVRFTNVKLDRSNLQGAILSKAELQSVSLREADLRGANFLGANLQDVNFAEAVYNHKTQFPSGFDISSQGLVNDDALPTVLEFVEKLPESSQPQTFVTQKVQKDSRSLLIIFLVRFSKVLMAVILSISVSHCVIVIPPPPPSPPPTSPPPPPAPPLPPPSPPPLPMLTKGEAMVLLNRYFQAKPQIFGPDYNLKPAYELLTGSLLKDVVSNSVPWLRNNDAYYTYQDYDIEALQFSAGNGVATLTVRVYEVLTFHWAGRSPKRDLVNDPYIYTIIYDENSQSWKIADVRKNR